MKELIISNPVGTFFFVLGFAITIILFLTAMFAPRLPYGELTNQLRNSNNNTQIILGVVAVICLVVSVVLFSICSLSPATRGTFLLPARLIALAFGVANLYKIE